jgi:SPX domain protein involved in polyphosphate accumulation
MLPQDRFPLSRADYPAAESAEALLSPSIITSADQAVTAYELKFLITADLAAKVESWAHANMRLDAFADPALGNAYQTTTLYLDTPHLDTFHRAEGFRRSKFRVRRYGHESILYVERKKRIDDTVAKRRADISMSDLSRLASDVVEESWPAGWFHQRIVHVALRPACRLTYDRVAFVRASDEGPLRVTLDRNIRGSSTDAWDLTPVDAGHRILADHVICEFKFRHALPQLFRDIIFSLDLQPGNCSKYRRMMLASGFPSSKDSPNA